MRLHEWVEVTGVKQRAAAEMFGISQGFFSEILRGEKRINDDLAARIEEVTKGQVTFLELKHPKFRKASND